MQEMVNIGQILYYVIYCDSVFNSITVCLCLIKVHVHLYAKFNCVFCHGYFCINIIISLFLL